MVNFKIKITKTYHIIYHGRFMFNGLRGEVIVRFVHICGIVDHHCLNYLFIIQVDTHCVIKFDSDLRQVCGFLRILRFPSPIKLTTTI